MTIYVDDFNVSATVGRRTSRWSHLITDSTDLDELHEFARRVGLRRSYFQGHDPKRPHYDVTADKRAHAIRLGAVKIGFRETPEVLLRRHDALVGPGTSAEEVR